MPDGRKALCSVCRGCCYQTPASITKPLQAERARFHGAPTACLMTTVEPAAPTTQTPQYWDGFKVLPPLNMRRRLSCRPQQQPPPAPWKCVAASMRIGTVSLSVVSPTFARTVGVLTAPLTAPTASPRRLGVGHPHVTGFDKTDNSSRTPTSHPRMLQGRSRCRPATRTSRTPRLAGPHVGSVDRR